MEKFNSAANWIAKELFHERLSNKVEAQKLLYSAVRAKFGLSAQMTILCIHRVCGAYKRDKDIRPTFRRRAAVTYDVRCMSYRGLNQVSLLTMRGRVLVPFVVGKYQREKFRHARKQADLVLREDGKWFLLVTVDVPDGAPIPSTDFVGIDLGIKALATCSDGVAYSGESVEKIRCKHNLQRKRLQRRNTKGARKKLKRIAGKEARFRRHENHCISKRIVDTAKRTGRGIALEDLTHVRDRVTARSGEARNRLGGWGFAQLGAFVTYKSKLAGVFVVRVDPRNTSRTCSACGHCSRANRKSQAVFSCGTCGFSCNADWNAARNIRALALPKRATGLAALAG
jgi:IS605 OrfB family transposase